MIITLLLGILLANEGKWSAEIKRLPKGAIDLHLVSFSNASESFEYQREENIGATISNIEVIHSEKHSYVLVHYNIGASMSELLIFKPTISQKPIKRLSSYGDKIHYTIKNNKIIIEQVQIRDSGDIKYKTIEVLIDD